MSSELVRVVDSKSKRRLLDWKELIAYKDLLLFLTLRGIKTKYAQSVLGVGWAVVQPLFTMLVFTILFGRIANVGSDGVPYALFSFSALIPWTFFSGSITEASNSLVGNANMLSKVYFPRLILPISSILSKLIDFSVTIGVMFALLLGFRFVPSYQIVFIPMLLILLILATAGPSILLSAWAVQYRDVKHVLTFVMQLLLYSVPVVYPLSVVPERFQWIYSLNPMVGIVEGFRVAILGTGPMPWNTILIALMSSIVLLIFGLYRFSRLERTFADVI